MHQPPTKARSTSAWMVGNRAETREELDDNGWRATLQALREKNYPAELVKDPSVGKHVIALLEVIRMHHNIHNNAFAVAGLKSRRLWLSKYKSSAVVLTREHHKRKVKSKAKAVTQYVVIDFSDMSISFPWKEIDEGAAKGQPVENE